MIQVEVKGGSKFSIDKVEGDTLFMDGLTYPLDIVKVNERQFHLILDHKSYTIDLVKQSQNGKELEILVNGERHILLLKDELDLTLEKMGMNHVATNKEKEVKAPMPGLILQVMVEPGSDVKKGDPLLILEAMKMENVIKSPTDGAIAKVGVKAGENVEKNHLLIELN